MVKKSSTFFLKTVLVLIGTAVLAGLIWLPPHEGRAANLDLISIYADPFIIYVYIAFTPFFVGIYQAIKLLGFIEKDKVFSEISVTALRNIKYSAIVFSAFIALALIYIRIMAQTTNDDPAGAMAIGIVLIFASSVIAAAAGVFQKLLQKAVDLKSENDLTV